MGIVRALITITLALAPTTSIGPANVPPQLARPSSVITTTIANPGERPEVIPREVWGAREPSCDWAGTDGNRVTHAVVHHTYEPTGEPSIESAYEALQHIQNLHMDDNSWCDIGYSYLVDWFGNVYEGARGTIERPITSAHTSGLNFEGAGIALIGRYQEIAPTDAAIEAAGRIAGWVLGWYGFEAEQDVTLTVGGANNKFASGARITVPAITAHRDVVNTECPGDAAYARLPEIRAIAAQVTVAMQDSGEFNSAGTPIFNTGSPSGPLTPADAVAAGIDDDEQYAESPEDEDIASEDTPATAGDNTNSDYRYVADGVDDDGETPGERATLELWWIAALVVAAAALIWWFLNRRNRQNL